MEDFSKQFHIRRTGENLVDPILNLLRANLLPWSIRMRDKGLEVDETNPIYLFAVLT